MVAATSNFTDLTEIQTGSAKKQANKKVQIQMTLHNRFFSHNLITNFSVICGSRVFQAGLVYCISIKEIRL